MRVEVYWNFHRKCYSVRALEGPYKGRVTQHRRNIQITDATFVVRPGGRAKTLRERRKNVHAFVRGTLVEGERIAMEGVSVGVGYNPYQWESFMAFPPSYTAPLCGEVTVDPYPIRSAKVVHLFTSGPENRSNMRAIP